MKKTLSILALCLSLMTAMAACDQTDKPGEDTDAETSAPAEDIALVTGGETKYLIVRGDNCGEDVTKAAVLLRKYMTSCGVETKVTTDWEGNGVSDYEIIVGDTERTAEQGNTMDSHSVGAEGYYARVSGTRIYIGGGSDAAVMSGVEAFLTEFFGYTGDASAASPVTDVTVPGDYSYTVKQEYALSAITVNGRNLDDYRIVVETATLSDREIAEEMQAAIYAECGAWLEIVGRGETWDGPTLILSNDAPSKEGIFEVTVDGENLVMKTKITRGFSRGFTLFFRDTIAGKTGTLALDKNFRYESNIGTTVLYSEFGAVGDGVTNDLPAIVQTHAYANANGLSVKADEGAVYYICDIAESAIIQTDTDWTGATFIIDDAACEFGQRTMNVFVVKSSYANVTVSGLTTLSRNQENLGVTLERDSIVILQDSGTKRYIREGENANSGSTQTDIIVVAKDGTIDPGTPLIWDYAQVTNAYAIPMDETTLTLTGGTFKTIANQAPSEYTYYARGIAIQRSNTVVDGLEHYIEGEGEHGAPYSGILQINNCANVTVQNCTFTAHKTYKLSSNAANSMGSYDISPSSVANLTFKNCTQTTDILDTAYWGVMGSNFCKNIVVDGCTFSRFDAHQGVANVTILNSTLGHQCLNAIGCGTLRVENSTLYGSSFINLRSDYGSTWEGDVVIKDCTWIPNRGKGVGTNALIGGSYSGFHDFGYECYMPATITIDGLYVDDSVHGSSYNGIYLLGNITPANTSANYAIKVEKKGYPYHITEKIVISNFSSASGLKWNLSPNTFMFQNVEIVDLDAAE